MCHKKRTQVGSIRIYASANDLAVLSGSDMAESHVPQTSELARNNEKRRYMTPALSA
jgi:hypothetical protein